MNPSPLDRLHASNPLAEIWWDSSPLVFDKWREAVIASAPAARREERREQVDRLMTPEDGVTARFRGCTTNPPLSLTAVKSDPDRWNRRIDELSTEHRELGASQLAWVLYKEVIRRGAEA